MSRKVDIDGRDAGPEHRLERITADLQEVVWSRRRHRCGSSAESGERVHNRTITGYLASHVPQNPPNASRAACSVGAV
jgi:hypothetical protein